MQARGLTFGATSGRTTLNGEGLQHEDGHSHVLSSTVPNCISYDPTFGYELAVIIQDGLRRMCAEQEDVYYYITVMNENYHHPAMPEGAAPNILKGMYKLADGAADKAGKLAGRAAPTASAPPSGGSERSERGGTRPPRVQLLGSGVILRQVMASAELLHADWGVTADIWSCPSFTELARDGTAVTRWNTLHPTETARVSHVEACLAGTKGPVIAATDYMRLFAEQIRPLVGRRYVVLGTDGFGRSDTREKLRHFFEVNPHYVTVAALKALADEGTLPAAKVAEAIRKYGLDPEKPAPWTV